MWSPGPSSRGGGMGQEALEVISTLLVGTELVFSC